MTIEMDDLTFIGYCEVHAETHLAMFVGRDLKRILGLAGNPKGYLKPSEIPETDWFSLDSEMKYLCKLARSRLNVSNG